MGNPFDDYVGCDVERGFGYAYNGDEYDEDFQGMKGYGSTPAVIGIDFFEGPYQDADGIDNEVGVLPGQALNGLGYGDSIIDNERFGMRRFVYYNNSTGQNGDPELAIHYYNYMRGIWKNGQKMRHGGDGYSTGGVENIETAFMFPGRSDPQHWGTTDENGITTTPNNKNWTERNTGSGSPNAPGDRRFLQSAGPFTLEPGNVNDITVGVVFAQAESGGVQASLDKAFNADDKAQALFDNCFQVLNGPDAPTLKIQELDQELILYISNPPSSNNANEDYSEVDPNIITPDTLLNMTPPVVYDNRYRFQGYQIYQLKAADVSVSQVGDPSLARLVFQCDIQDGIKTLTNYTFDDGIGANIADQKVKGADEGISHSFRVTEDLFAEGQTRLINYKTYYYIAIAYAHNNYKTYKQDQAPDLSNPLAAAYDGQKMPYLGSRRAADGSSIASVAGIPHSIRPEKGGTNQNSNYGDLVQITRLQGQGNGNHAIELTGQTLDRLMADKAWESNVNPVQLDYKLGKGPIAIKVVDPLNLVDGRFYFKMLDDKVGGKAVITNNAKWMIWKEGGDTVYADNAIKTRTEQLLFNPNWGLSILIEQTTAPGLDLNNNNGFINARIEYADSSKAWLTGIADGDGMDEYNWILSGQATGSESEYGDINNPASDGGGFRDLEENFENMLGGRWAPYGLVGYGLGPSGTLLKNKVGYNEASVRNAKLEYLSSTVIVYTKDKSKWTRCPVIEMQEITTNAINGDPKYSRRTLGSIDKNGNQWKPGDPVNLTDPNSASYIDSIGMGWFPGYAINMETGERLNMAYGEDSYFGIDNGADMIWNPTSVESTGALGSNLVWGGKHVTYVFRKTLPIEGINFPIFQMNTYDGGKKLSAMLASGPGKPYAYRAINWVNIPMLAAGKDLLETEARVYLNVSRPYDTMQTVLTEPILENEGRPVYTFQTKGIAVQKDQLSTLKDALEQINIVPNPYYAISDYEKTSLDNVAKLINLPERCNIKIYNVSGTLIREYKKSDPLNFLDWDLKNQVGIPISSGVYIIHIDVPNAGEKILKWFGIMRPVDLNNF